MISCPTSKKIRESKSPKRAKERRGIDRLRGINDGQKTGTHTVGHGSLYRKKGKHLWREDERNDLAVFIRTVCASGRLLFFPIGSSSFCHASLLAKRMYLPFNGRNMVISPHLP